MAFFKTKKDGGLYEQTYCAHCVHQQGCPVLELHQAWNDEQHGVTVIQETKRLALETLIPQGSAGPGPCRLFQPKQTSWAGDEFEYQVMPITSIGLPLTEYPGRHPPGLVDLGNHGWMLAAIHSPAIGPVWAVFYRRKAQGMPLVSRLAAARFLVETAPGSPVPPPFEVPGFAVGFPEPDQTKNPVQPNSPPEDDPCS